LAAVITWLSGIFFYCRNGRTAGQVLETHELMATFRFVADHRAAIRYLCAV
jgi:hypothetical protein